MGIMGVMSSQQSQSRGVQMQISFPGSSNQTHTCFKYLMVQSCVRITNVDKRFQGPIYIYYGIKYACFPSNRPSYICYSVTYNTVVGTLLWSLYSSMNPSRFELRCICTTNSNIRLQRRFIIYPKNVGHWHNPGFFVGENLIKETTFIKMYQIVINLINFNVNIIYTP